MEKMEMKVGQKNSVVGRHGHAGVRLFSLLLAVCCYLLTETLQAQIAAPTTVQLPVFGVSIDAEGLLQAKMIAGTGGPLFLERAAAARRDFPADLLAKSKLRKVSLARLEKAIEARLADENPPTEEMLKLAGLISIDYVFLFPDEHDIVIAGPAEGWILDAGDRSVGVTTNRPIVLLEDLLVALRLFAPDRPANTWVGCSIDPTREGLEKLAEFNRTIPAKVSTNRQQELAEHMRLGMQESLGAADVRTFSIASTNHLAQVLIEADYRMKLIAIGLEPPPIEMATFASRLRSPPRNSMQRWWFTPNYECVKVTDDRLAMQLIGDGVQLLTEDYQLGADGKLELKDAKPSGASLTYSQTFTRKYAEIAAASPVFAQLRNMVDVLVVAAYLNHEHLYELSGWRPKLLLDANRLPVETLNEIKHAPCIVNTFWKGNRLIAPAGGGVSILPIEALSEQNLIKDQDGQLAAIRAEEERVADRWWWD
jgi:hypothetical protein